MFNAGKLQMDTENTVKVGIAKRWGPRKKKVAASFWLAAHFMMRCRQ